MSRSGGIGVRALTLAAIAVACADGEPPRPAASPGPADSPAAAPQSPPPPPAAPPAETGEGWTQEPVDGGGPVHAAATLTAVRTAAHGGHDRIVFEFAGGMPGYRVRWADSPITQCGSGAAVNVPGQAVLEISFEPAAAHDDAGQATIQERARTLELDRLRSLRLICDFEAHVDWVAGTTGRGDFRVLTLRDPPRLAVDLRH